MEKRTIGQFLISLEDGTLDVDPATQHQIRRALDNLLDGPGNEESRYFDPETGRLDGGLELEDEFLEQLQHEIETLTQNKPMSEKTFLGLSPGGNYSEYSESALREAEDGLKAMQFLDNYRDVPFFTTLVLDDE